MTHNTRTRVLIAVAAVVTMALAASPTLAQFKVLAVRGSVTLTGQKTIKIGQQITTKDQLKLGKDGYIGLSHDNGKAVELSKSGTYKVKDLDAAASKKGKSSTSKFASYVVEQLTEVDDPIEFSDNRRTKMRTTGSVERAAGDELNMQDSARSIARAKADSAVAPARGVLSRVGVPGEMLALSQKQEQDVHNGDLLAIVTPTHTRLLGDSVVFIWHRSPKVTTYRVVIIGRDGTAASALESKDTVVVASLAALKLNAGQVYYWHLEDGANASFKSDQYALYLLQGDERRSAEALLADVRSDYDTEDAAIGKLVLAAACEEMGLYQDAHMAYRKAVELAPDVQNYKRMYADFLKRQGLNMDAYAAYQ